MTEKSVRMLADSGALVRYDAMCHAIAAAYKVDEVKDIRDKALALERYAAQANNVEAERQACEIRLRAERRSGQLIREMEKAKGARAPGTNRGATPSHDARASPPQTLGDLGVSHKQSSDWQKLATIPDEDFEHALRGGKPTTSGIIASHAPAVEKPRDKVDAKALALWGMIQDFEQNGFLVIEDPNTLLTTMLPHMVETTKRLAPVLATWLERIER